jgi:adenosine deaminase
LTWPCYDMAVIEIVKTLGVGPSRPGLAARGLPGGIIGRSARALYVLGHRCRMLGMSLSEFVRRMPKAELHVHLEGSVEPETLLELAQRNKVPLPAKTVEELRAWYTFTSFHHFIEVYWQLSECIRSAEDIEFVAREFLKGQAKQHILYSEVTYTAYTHYAQKGIPFGDQLAALNRARVWGEETLGIRMGLVIDIPREISAGEGKLCARWAISGMGSGVVALGLGGNEAEHPPEKFADAFALAEEAGLPSVPHAGEMAGPKSIWGALDTLKAVRIGHGVRCLEDPALVRELRERQIPLEVCPTSNLCLGIVPDLRSHPLPRLVEEGLCVTMGSDDPALFNTTLTDEYLKIAEAFDYDVRDVVGLVANAVRASLLDDEGKAAVEQGFKTALLAIHGTSASELAAFDIFQ